MTSKKDKKTPTIGAIFSSDSSDEDIDTHPPPRLSKTDISDSERRKRVSLRVNVNGGESEHSSTSKRKPVADPEPDVPDEVADGYVSIDKTRIGTIKHNTLIQYETTAGKVIKPKYFKKYDSIAKTFCVGFYTHNKRNYSESVSNIKSFFVQQGSKGESDILKDTIEVPSDQWSTLRRDMVITYEKVDHEYVYRAKFNSFMKGTDGSTRMSLTSERGFNYIANPTKIIKVFRHMTSNDKTLTFILEALRKLESRVRALEANQKKNPTRS